MSNDKKVNYIEQQEITNYVDDLPYIIILQMDELGILFGFVSLGILSSNGYVLIASIFLSVIILQWFSRQKSKFLHGFFLHIPYQFGLIPLNKWFAFGNQQEFVE